MINVLKINNLCAKLLESQALHHLQILYLRFLSLYSLCAHLSSCGQTIKNELGTLQFGFINF